MNTITITNEINEVVTYNEVEITSFIKRLASYRKESIDTLYKVRDFFSEREWSDSETTITRDEVNEMLRSINAEPIRGKWSATVTITARVTQYEAEDENDALNCIEEDISIDIGSGADIEIESTDVSNIEEDN